MGRNSLLAMIAVLILATTGQGGAAGDPEAGAQVFRTCAACHTLEPGVHRTGPSLAGVFGRKAGTAEGFHRYSDALRSADLVWREDTLNGFLADPQAFLPGNRMTFSGIADAQARADVIAYLQTDERAREAAAEAVGAGRHDGDAAAARSAAGGRAEQPDHLDPLLRRHLHGRRRKRQNPIPFWEFNLRFKTDSSDKGPEPGHPVLIPASMMGDRAFVIFAAPEEISRFIEAKC